MARGGGFLSRIGRAIRNVVAPRPAPTPPPEPPPPREPANREWRDVWRNEGGQGSYRKNLRVFHKVVDPIESDPDEQIALWESYVHNIVRKGRQRRNSTSNMFWRDSGIDPADFDWKLWREAMGYTGKRRSRTP
jgi:hypothetical protein